MRLQDEFSSSSLDENKITIKYDKMSLILEGESQVPSLVEKNDLAIVKEPSLKEKQVEKKHPKLIVENVLVEVERLSFPHRLFEFWHGRGPTSFLCRKTFHCHKSSVLMLKIGK